MQQEKFECAEKLLEATRSNQPTQDPLFEIPSPKSVRSGSRDYYKFKFEQAMKMLNYISEADINLKAAGILNVSKIKQNDQKKQVRLTQIYGSMDGNKAIEVLEKLQKEKSDKEKKKKDRLDENEHKKEVFLRCKSSCVCTLAICAASGLKQCISCHGIVKSSCSKKGCIGKTGGKPAVICVKYDQKLKKN